MSSVGDLHMFKNPLNIRLFWEEKNKFIANPLKIKRVRKKPINIRKMNLIPSEMVGIRKRRILRISYNVFEWRNKLRTVYIILHRGLKSKKAYK